MEQNRVKQVGFHPITSGPVTAYTALQMKLALLFHRQVNAGKSAVHWSTGDSTAKTALNS